MKAIKIAILKLVFLLIVLIGTIAAYFVFTYEKTEDPAESISTATLPVITMKYREQDRKSTRLNSSHRLESRMPSSA